MWRIMRVALWVVMPEAARMILGEHGSLGERAEPLMTTHVRADLVGELRT